MRKVADHRRDQKQTIQRKQTSHFTNLFLCVLGVLRVADAAESGLDYYKADDDFRDVNGQIAGVYKLSKNWRLPGIVKYSYIVGEAADSPIVDDEGSESQLMAGFGAAYSW